MPNTELRKKTAYFLVFAGLVALVLILFPFVEELVYGFLSTRFGIPVSPDGSVAIPSGDAPGKMTATSISLVVNILHILRLILMMALVIAVVRFLSYLVTQTLYRNAVAKGEASSLLRTVLAIIVYIVAFFILFQAQFPGIDLSSLFTGSTILGIVVGLAVQDTLGNLFAGLALQADQPFQVGDVITMTNRGSGVVESVSWRGVKIRTFQNKLLIVSNAVLGREIIEVAPKNNLNARLVHFSTEYDYSPARTIHVVRDAVRHAENVSSKIRPIVRIVNLGDDGIEWEIKYWLDDYSKYNDSDALVRQRIWYAFNRDKIDFAYPSRTIYMASKTVDAAPEDLFNSIAERLNMVSIFGPLCDDEVEQLANSSTSRVYAPGERIVRMGQEGGSMFVIIRGQVKIQIPENDYQKTLTKLYENDFFGEMSLLTGEPRSANVVAVEETEVLRIDKNGLKPILENNPQLVESISVLIEERKELLNAGTSFTEEDKAETRKGVMRSIKGFFGLK